MALNGGKGPLAAKIVALMPPRVQKPNAPADDDPGYIHYVEPYCGGCSVLLANDPVGISEVVNDLDGDLTNFWHVLKNVDLWTDFQRVVQAIPFSEAEFKSALAARVFDTPVDRAVNFFVLCRQSLSGRMKGFAGITRNRTRQGRNEQCAAWLSAVEGLPLVHARMIRVLVRNIPALECIKKEDGKRTLFYLDPPYVHDTRATTGEYAHEMYDAAHRELLTLLNVIEGRFMLSGYRCEMYDEWAEQSNFRRHDFEVANHSAGGKKKQRRTECVWMNY